MSDDLLRDLVRIADQECTVRTSLRVERTPRNRRPPALLPDIRDGACVAREEFIGGLLRRGRDVTQRGHANLETIGRMPRTCARLTVEIDQGTKTPRLSPDDGDHQTQPEDAGPGEGLRCPSDPQPHRQPTLHGSQPDALA